jgi:hypothetical protein
MNPIAKNAVVHIKRVDFLNVEIDDDDLVPQHHVIVLYRNYLHLVQRYLWGMFTHIFLLSLSILFIGSFSFSRFFNLSDFNIVNNH